MALREIQPLEIRHIHVRKGALDVEVATALDTLRVTPELVKAVLSSYPNLAHHVCVNGAGDGSFGDEIEGTELPHLLEHLIIELQGRQSAGCFAPTGHTSWLAPLEDTRPSGYVLMRVTVTFEDDFIALRALNMAVDLLEGYFRGASE